MNAPTQALFRDDAYQRRCEAEVVGVSDHGGILLDRTIFYPTGGGQPGDIGTILVGGELLQVATTVYGDTKSDIVHVPAEPVATLEVGAPAVAELDWERRFRHMRMHTAMHLLCSLVPYPVTGGSIGAAESRLDFDISDAGAVDKDELVEKLNAMVAADHPVTTRWITDAELDANPGLVRTMSVQPPRGSGRIRLVAIGADSAIDLQPCGGTHVRSTAEIGTLVIPKIEKKGRQNRRIRLAFAESA
jgi:misacylated tRNA(Ala) deacylase